MDHRIGRLYHTRDQIQFESSEKAKHNAALEKDIEALTMQLSITRDEAMVALEHSNWDVVDALMNWTGVAAKQQDALEQEVIAQELTKHAGAPIVIKSVATAVGSRQGPSGAQFTMKDQARKRVLQNQLRGQMRDKAAPLTQTCRPLSFDKSRRPAHQSQKSMPTLKFGGPSGAKSSSGFMSPSQLNLDMQKNLACRFPAMQAAGSPQPLMRRQQQLR
jgi:hypothetical protein